MLFEQVAEIIRGEMHGRGWSMQDLANAVGTDEATVADYLDGVQLPEPHVIDHLFAALGLAPVLMPRPLEADDEVLSCPVCKGPADFERRDIAYLCDDCYSAPTAVGELMGAALLLGTRIVLDPVPTRHEVRVIGAGKTHDVSTRDVRSPFGKAKFYVALRGALEDILPVSQRDTPGLDEPT